MSFIKSFVLALMLSLCACDGGKSSSSTSATSEPRYFVELEKNSVDIELSYDYGEVSQKRRLEMRFSGAGLVVGFADGEFEASLIADFISINKSSAVLELSWSENARMSSPGTYSYDMLVYVIDEEGDVVGEESFVINILQRDGFRIGAGDLLATDGKETGSFELVTGGMAWTVTSTVAGVSFDPAAGVGSQIVNIQYDYDEIPPGDLDVPIKIRGTDAAGVSVEKNLTASVHNRLNFSYQDLEINGFWGAEVPGEVTFQVLTGRKNWQLTSDIPGVVFKPSSGSGSMDVVVTYDQDIIAGQSYANIQLSHAGETVTKPLSILITPPYLVSQRCDFRLHWSTANMADTAEFMVSVESGGEIGWHVESFPEWLIADATSGVTGQPLRMRANSSVLADPAYGTEFQIVLDVKGSPIPISCYVGLTVDAFRFIPDRGSFAFTDLSGSQVQSGRVNFLNNARAPGAVTDLIPSVVSASPWLKIDEVDSTGFNFHVDSSLADAEFQVASIAISYEDEPWVQATEVNVGLYKTEAILIPHSLPISDSVFLHTQDRLGPWYYLTDRFIPGQINIFNPYTRTLEEPLVLSENANIVFLDITNNGRHLIAMMDDRTLVKYDLIANTVANRVVAGDFGGDDVKLIELNGKHLLSVNTSIWDLDNWQKLRTTAEGFSPLLSASGAALTNRTNSVLQFVSHNCTLFSVTGYAPDYIDEFRYGPAEYFSDENVLDGMFNASGQCIAKHYVTEGLPYFLLGVENQAQLFSISAEGIVDHVRQLDIPTDNPVGAAVLDSGQVIVPGFFGHVFQYEEDGTHTVEDLDGLILYGSLRLAADQKSFVVIKAVEGGERSIESIPLEID